MKGFFRRIRKKLADENRYLQYSRYAVGEIVLVMVGILLALQVNNWNEERISTKRERLLLKEINTEFKFNKHELESTVRSYIRIREHCNYLISAFPLVGSDLDMDSLAVAFYRMRDLHSADLSMGSITTLINTSSFEIISNTELRTLLIQWEDLISDYFEREGQAKHYVQQTVIPYLARRIPQPYNVGLKDNRTDLSFLNTIEFENLIYDRQRDVSLLLHVVEDENTTVRTAIERIIELTHIDANE